jgi:hypothetical protein
MDSPGADDHIERFVLELLRTGCMLSDLASDLIEALPEEAYPGEDPAAVVIEMMSGTIATALAYADPADLRRATELIDVAATRTIEHLRLARDLSRRTDGDGGTARTYG